MGKKRVALIGDVIDEDVARKKRAVQREQKAIRKGKKIKSEEQTTIDLELKKAQADKTKSVPITFDVTKVSGMKGGERVVDTASESLEELERLQAKEKEIVQLEQSPDGSTPTVKPKRVRSQRYQQAKSKITDGKSYPVPEALELLRKLNLTRFPASLELHLNLIKQDTFTNQPIDLPHGSGKTKNVAVVNAQLLKQLDQGKIDFDVLLASKEDMPQLVKYAKLLGPKGLMPNPKSGTIVDNPQKAASKFTADNRLELKIEKKAPLIHAVVGKMNMKDTQLDENIKTIITTVGNKNIRKAYLATTMSPSIRITVS